jgi:hypothetical protein
MFFLKLQLHFLKDSCHNVRGFLRREGLRTCGRTSSGVVPSMASAKQRPVLTTSSLPSRRHAQVYFWQQDQIRPRLLGVAWRCSVRLGGTWCSAASMGECEPGKEEEGEG